MVSKVEAHTDDINAVAFADRHYRSHLIVTGSDDSLIKVWDRRILGKGRAGLRPAGVLPGHSEGITHISPRGDGRYMLSNGKDQVMLLVCGISYGLCVLTLRCAVCQAVGLASYAVSQ